MRIRDWSFVVCSSDLKGSGPARSGEERVTLGIEKKRTPPGVHRAEDAPAGRFRIPGIKVRCRRQPADAPPMFCRHRFGWNAREVSGALGDLGTFLPHIIGAITVVGMAPAGILTTFGLFYIAAGAFYGVPMAVQPMKAASAAVLIEPMDPAAIAGAGLVIGAFFLLVGLPDRKSTRLNSSH